MVPFSFSGEEMWLVKGRALFWPRQDVLLVADLHLEKASFYAKTGQMLPPYDSRETLERLALAIRQTAARRVFALGDSFHDRNAATRLEPYAASMLTALTRTVDWVWIAGNHDAELDAHTIGRTVNELAIGGLVLRHKAKPGEPAPELSGHFHPKITVRARGRRIVRPCVVVSASDTSAGRLILPAFGALTGGMSADNSAIHKALQPANAIDAIFPAAGQIIQYPLWRAAA